MKAALAIILASAAAHAGDLDSILTPLAYAPAKSQAHAAADSGGGPAVVTGQGGNFQIGQKAVADALQRELAARYALEGDLHIEFSQPWTPVDVRNAKDWKLTITQAPAGGPSQVFPVSFQIEAGGKLIGSYREGLKAKLLAPVWTATRRLDRGNPLDASSCTLKTIDTLANSAPHLPPTADLSIYEAAQTVQEGQPVTARDVALRPLVRKNQLVDVIVNEGALQISMKGIALATAGAGETVSVRNIDSKKDFQAQVVSPNTVQVRF